MRRSAPFFALVLLILPLIVVTYRVIWLKYPLVPASPGKAWELYMVARVKPSQNGITIQVGLPTPSAQQTVMEERIYSGDLLFNLLREGPDQIGIWSGTSLAEEAFVSYRAIILINPKAAQPTRSESPPVFTQIPSKQERNLLRRLTEKWVSLPLPERFRHVAAAIGGRWEPSTPDLQDLHQWSIFVGTYGKERAAMALLQACGLSARIVAGIPLTEGIFFSPQTWIEAWTGKE